MLGAMSQQFHCWKIIATTLGQGRTHGCEGLDGHHHHMEGLGKLIMRHITIIGPV